MAFIITKVVNGNCVRSLEEKLLTLSVSCTSVRSKTKLNPPPKLRNPTWFTQKIRLARDNDVTVENKEFLKEVVQDRYHNAQSPLITGESLTNVEWTPKSQRTGLIARKLGIYPMWTKNGKRFTTTLLQVLDNHVIKYYPPESYSPPRKHPTTIFKPKACLLLGAEGADPSNFTREYCGIFKDSGVIPKKTLARFFISPDAAVPTGTLLNAMHFKVGNYVDVRGLTIDRGFQGVMKRYRFAGMPASHGTTKTHRRPGNIGGGGEKARVWPGTKLPGHMGNRWRTLRGLKVWRINTKYNVLYVSGQNIPGATNSIVYIYDSKLFCKRSTEPLPFPTYSPNDEDDFPEDIYDELVHGFGEPSIMFNESS